MASWSARARESESAREREGEEVRVWCTGVGQFFELDEGEEGRVSCILMCFKILIKLFKLIEKFVSYCIIQR